MKKIVTITSLFFTSFLVSAAPSAWASVITCTAQTTEYTDNHQPYGYSFALDTASAQGTWTESWQGATALSFQVGCRDLGDSNYFCSKTDGNETKEIRISNIGFGTFQASFSDEVDGLGGYGEYVPIDEEGCTFN